MSVLLTAYGCLETNGGNNIFIDFPHHAVRNVTRCEATQFAVAATNHSALGSGEMRSAEMRSDDVK